jgi:hypothetical protein
MGIDAGLKICPGCGERVRNRVRRCPSCDYSFEARGSGGHSPEAAASVAELLEEWGTPLRPGETLAFFLPAQARALRDSSEPAREGFLLVTDRRLIYFESRRALPWRGRPLPAVAFERRLADLGEVRIDRRWSSARLRIGEQVALSGITPQSKLEELSGFLGRRLGGTLSDAAQLDRTD